MSETFRHKRVAIDFDGTLVEESNDINKDFEHHILLKAMDGARESTKFLKDQGFEILIFTCRPDYHRKYMEKILGCWEISYDYILFYTKPRVDLYIDDKGLRFTDWNSTQNWIKERL